MKSILIHYFVAVIVLTLFSCSAIRPLEDGLDKKTIDPPKILISKVVDSKTPLLRDANVAMDMKAALADMRVVAEDTSFTLLEITPVEVKEGQKILYSINETCIEPDTEYEAPVKINLSLSLTRERLSEASKEQQGELAILKAMIMNNNDDPNLALAIKEESPSSLCIQAVVVEEGVSSPKAIFEYRIEEATASDDQACIVPKLSLSTEAMAGLSCGSTIDPGQSVSVMVSKSRLDPCDQMIYVLKDSPQGGASDAVYDPNSPLVFSEPGYYYFYFKSSDSNKIMAASADIACSFTISADPAK